MSVDSSDTVGPTRRLSVTGGGATAVGGRPVWGWADTAGRSPVPELVASPVRTARGVAAETRRRAGPGRAEVCE